MSQTLLEGFDGLLFTGSPSNVEPLHYQGPSSDPGTHHDPERDSTTLPLIRAAVAIGIPVLGICRGYQEMNVALGGSLHQKVHEVAGLMDHREPAEKHWRCSMRRAIRCRCSPVACSSASACTGRCRVNSLHGQGVERLAPGLRIEALAPDGLIEAFSVEAARRFALGVQWHPEWQVQEIRTTCLSSRHSARPVATGGDTAGRLRIRAQAAPSTREVGMNPGIDQLTGWLDERRITEVECLVSDLTGIVRGKISPTSKFVQERGMRLPESVLLQTVTGDYVDEDIYYELLDPADIDMFCRPDPNAAFVVPWASEPTAQVIHDTYDKQGRPIELSPRNVLKRVLALYAERGWQPIVAPEMEFYLTRRCDDPDCRCSRRSAAPGARRPAHRSPSTPPTSSIRFSRTCTTGARRRAWTWTP